jgi:hypothetical protein
VDTYELNSISEHDQLAEEVSRRGKVIAHFYRSMVDAGLPPEMAGTIVVDWARMSMQPTDLPNCGCDCEICRGDA